jgi:hypothetical protein
MVYGVWNIVWNCKGTAGFFMETTRNLNLNVEALKYVMSTIYPGEPAREKKCKWDKL